MVTILTTNIKTTSMLENILQGIALRPKKKPKTKKQKQNKNKNKTKKQNKY